MKKIIRLTESDLRRIVNRVLTEGSVETYVVMDGDNLTKIAKINGTTVGEILKMNPQIKDANKIYPGDKISLPKVIFKPIDKSSYLYDEKSETKTPNCVNLMVRKKNDGSVGGSPYESLKINGEVMVTYNGTVSPNYRSVTVVKDGVPFCKIPASNIGDCRSEMTLNSDMPGSDMSATLDGPVLINISGPVAPENRGTTISDANGYFCKVPSVLVPESRIRRRRF